MTEKMKEWATKLTGEANTFDVSEAEFWIRAFCDEVDSRVRKDSDTFWTDLGIKYATLKVELLGDFDANR